MRDGAPDSALIVRLSSIGDVIHAIPAYMAVRSAWPGTSLGWAVEPPAAPLVRRLPGPLRLHLMELPRRGALRRPLAAARTLAGAIRELREPGYEIALDLQGLIKSAVVGRLSGAETLGFDRRDLREPVAARLYRRTAPPLAPRRHAVSRGLDLLEAAGVDPAGADFPDLTDAEDRGVVDEGLTELGVEGFVLVHGHANWPSKTWPPSRYPELGRLLFRRLRRPVLWLWGPGERARAELLARRAGDGNLACFPTTLTQLQALLRRADLFVGGDSAPLHLAAATGTPTVAIFGPTDPARNGSLCDDDLAVVHTLPCSHCYARRCPLGTIECMRSVGVDEVVEAAARRLGETVRPTSAPRRAAGSP